MPAAAAPSIKKGRCCQRPCLSSPATYRLLLGDSRWQMASMELHVDCIELAIAMVGQNPAIDPFLEPWLILIESNTKIKILLREFQFKILFRCTLDHFTKVRWGARENLDLTSHHG